MRNSWKGLSTALSGMAALAGAGNASGTPARYVGKLITQWQGDGRSMVLTEPFEFIDAKGLHWPVPKGTYVDGASIPWPLWSIIGGPFEGKYRDASVIHDFYCDVHLRQWREVDRMFYDAMIASGVDERQAKVMYLGVLWGGPRWTSQSIKNNAVNMKLASAKAESTRKQKEDYYSSGDTNISFEDAHDNPNQRDASPIVVTGSVFGKSRYTTQLDGDMDEFSIKARQVRQSNPSLATIEKMADDERDEDTDQAKK